MTITITFSGKLYGQGKYPYTDRFSANFAEVSGEGIETQLHADRNASIRDFVEKVVDKVVADNETIETLIITQEYDLMDEGMQEYLSDKYPLITFG